jgi:hypothetical protein
MLSSADLVTLRRSLRDAHVLSVFVDRSADDPAEQRSWRTALDDRLATLRNQLKGASANERAEFEQCVELAGDAIANAGATAGAVGWAAFVTAEGVQEVRALGVAMPTFAMWSAGAWLLPCLRVAREARPVVTVVADARHASLYVSRNGEVEQVERLRSHHEVQNPPLHMGSPSRQGFHSGTRGTTGRDSAQRGLLTGRDHMVAEAADRLSRLAGDDGWILVAGIKAVRARLCEDLNSIAPNRVLELESLDVHASDPEIAAAARAGASALREGFDLQRIRELREQAGPRGLGALGSEATKDALEHVCVHELYLSPRFVDEHPIDAESDLRAALDQDARVEEVAGRAADLLDDLGGIAAALRFRPTDAGTTAAA